MTDTLPFWVPTNRKTPKLFMWPPLGTISMSAFHLHLNYYYYTVRKERVTQIIAKAKITLTSEWLRPYILILTFTTS